MPFHVGIPQGSATINHSHINQPPSTDTSPEMHLWEQVKTFFDSSQESDALACIRNISHPPAGTTREEVENRFEQLRALAYPGYKENIQSGRYGENHFCILGENGQEMLSVTQGDNGTYTVEYGEGRIIRYPFTQIQQEPGSETGNTAEAPIITTPLTAEECEAIWSEWESPEYYSENKRYENNLSYSEKNARARTVEQLRACLNSNTTQLTLYGIDTVTSLPEALPPHITELTIVSLRLTHLPPLPSGLQGLHIENATLTHLPPLPSGLNTLALWDLQLTSLPELPPRLQTLTIVRTPLVRLPTLPHGLQALDIYEAPLPHLPPLPPALQILKIYSPPLTHLPPLPSGLNKLTLKALQLTSLPELPSGLNKLTLKELQLTSLPELPPGLQTLDIRNLPLTYLPPLPPTLQRLIAYHLPLSNGLEDVVNLSSAAVIELSGSTMSERMIRTLRHLTSEPGYSGPRIRFSRTTNSLPREARSLHQAVANWLTPTEGETAASADRWKAFEQENHGSSFSLFLDRLSDTKNFRQNSEFKTQVSSWLTQLAEDNELRAKTFAMATESTSSCEDRVTLAMNQMKRVQLVHQAEKGLFDEHIPELIAAGREMFRLEKLEQIAREKAKLPQMVDEIEVWLGYQNRLKESLGLTSVTAEMRFFDVSGITGSDLQIAEDQVKTAENSQFATWVLQWEPLRSLLQRTEQEHWDALIEKKGADYQDQYQKLYDTELKPAGLVGDTGAESIIGTRAMENAEKAFLEGLRVLTDQKLAGHLQEYWF